MDEDERIEWNQIVRRLESGSNKALRRLCHNYGITIAELVEYGASWDLSTGRLQLQTMEQCLAAANAARAIGRLRHGDTARRAEE